jgi:hypothetical protein
MMSTKLTVAVIATSFALLGGIFALAPPALAKQYLSMSSLSNTSSPYTAISSNMTSDGFGSMMGFNSTGKMFGIVSSIQNDEGGKPAWIATGHWMLTNGTGSSNATGSSTNISDFDAAFYMTNLDGSGQHTHRIYNFTQEGNSTTSGNATTVKGMATVTMKDGPVNDVETQITISQGNVIAISLDPDATKGHFGDTPIYGMTITPKIMQHIMCEVMSMHTNATAGSTMMGKTGGLTENATAIAAMMGDHCNNMQGNTTAANAVR